MLAWKDKPKQYTVRCNSRSGFLNLRDEMVGGWLGNNGEVEVQEQASHPANGNKMLCRAVLLGGKAEKT